MITAETVDYRYRLSVRADIERIKDVLGSERWRRASGTSAGSGAWARPREAGDSQS